MKILSDEDTIWTELIDRLNQLCLEYGCSFVAFPKIYHNRSIPDDEVAKICRDEGAAALLTANYTDFAARIVYYQALLSEGISAVVLRQPNPHTYRPDVDYQVDLIAAHLRNITRRLEKTNEPLLFILNKSGLRIRRLQELVDQLSP